jgi:hypothetical protein
MHTSKSSFLLNGGRYENIAICESLNSIKHISVMRRYGGNFSNVFIVDSGLTSFLKSPRYGDSLEHDIFYLSLRAFIKAITHSEYRHMSIKGRDLELKKEDVILIGKALITPVEGELIKLSPFNEGVICETLEDTKILEGTFAEMKDIENNDNAKKNLYE